MTTNTHPYPENITVSADSLAYRSRHLASTGAASEGKGGVMGQGNESVFRI
jgi:hypothetical protein